MNSSRAGDDRYYKNSEKYDKNKDKLGGYEIFFYVVALIIFIIAICIEYKLHTCSGNCTMKPNKECTGDNCNVTKPMSKEEEVYKIINSLFVRSIWSASYIGSFIITIILCIWFWRRIPHFSVFFVMLLICFIVIYFVLSFTNQHYYKPMSERLLALLNMDKIN